VKSCHFPAEYFFARGDAETQSKKVYNKKHLRVLCVSASPRLRVNNNLFGCGLSAPGYTKNFWLLKKNVVFYKIFKSFCRGMRAKRHAPCAMRYAPCAMRYALCAMRYAPSPWPPEAEQGVKNE
jgi:hypothetical protein